jgi:putative colanic acid biosysnthesis UDP-glucose lipid carrier transferase
MSSRLKYFFLAGDVILLNASILWALYLFDPLFLNDHRATSAYLVVYSNLAWFFLVLISTPYNVTRGWAPSRIFKAQVIFILVHLLVIASLIAFFNKSYSWLTIITIYLLFVPLFFAYRIVSFYTRRVLIHEPRFRNYVLIGKNELSAEIRKFYMINPQMNYRFKGYIAGNEAEIDIDTIREFCSVNEVHEIVCCVSQSDEEGLKKLVNFGLDSLIKVRVVFDAITASPQAIQLERFERLPGTNLAAVALDDPLNQLVKRIFDLIFSSIFCLLILSWLIPLVGLIIKLDSRGPVFFTQMRNGLSNTPFRCLKFRTMVQNNQSESLQATKDDSRITRVGAFLRKSSIDELPQFINVLIGDMSLIGPRPHPIKLNEKFSPTITNIMSRHYVKPGITGLAQCMGYRGETANFADMENRFKLDRFYIENWTFWLDIKIIFLTVVSLIRGSDKAY